MSKANNDLKQLKSFNPASLPLPAKAVAQELEAFLKTRSELPLDLEIGPGVGLHPIVYASENPLRALLAVEHTREKFEKFQRRHFSHGHLVNLLAVHAHAISFAHHLLADSSLERCFILYPNPNPKNLNQRWHAMPFMQRLLELLKPKGEIVIATNEEFYANEAVQWMTEYWNLELAQKTLMTQSNFNPLNGRTHFERKYLIRGEVCYNLVFKKK